MKIAVQGLPGLQTLARQFRDTALPNGALSKAVASATQAYADGTQRRAHRDTGTMASAQTAEVTGLLGRVYTANASNPKTGQAASVYAPAEEARGGAHAFYAPTFAQDTPHIAAEALRIITGALP